MDHTVEAAIRVGHRHPDPILDLEELASQVEGSLGELPPRCRTVGARLRGRQDLFRILDPWRGPLRAGTRATPGAAGLREILEAYGLPRRAWVVPREPAADPRTRDRIREGVAALARVVDDGSLRSLLRIARMLREARALTARRAGSAPDRRVS